MKAIIRFTILAYLSLVQCICTLALPVTPAHAEEIQEIKGAGPLFSKSAKIQQQSYRQLFEKLDAAVPDTKIKAHFDLIRRAIRDLEEGKIDFYYPVLCDEARGASELTRLGSEPMGYIPMGLFSRSSNPITASDLHSAGYRITKKSLVMLESKFPKTELEFIKQFTIEFKSQEQFLKAISQGLKRRLTDKEKSSLSKAAFKYVVETVSPHAPYVGTPTFSSNSVESSIVKLARGRIDAYIDAPLQIEGVIGEKSLSDSIFRALHKLHTGCYLVRNDEDGERVDHILQRAFRSAKENGDYDAIFGETDRLEENWVDQYRER